jgi:hypothetical protein
MSCIRFSNLDKYFGERLIVLTEFRVSTGHSFTTYKSKTIFNLYMIKNMKYKSKTI